MCTLLRNPTRTSSEIILRLFPKTISLTAWTSEIQIFYWIPKSLSHPLQYFHVMTHISLHLSKILECRRYGMDFDATSQRWRIYKSNRTTWQNRWMSLRYGSEQIKIKTCLICITRVYQHGTKTSLIRRWSSVRSMGHRTELKISLGVSLLLDV